MPQDPVLMQSKEDGSLVYMHSVDASDALRLGDYEIPDPAKVDPVARAAASNRMRSMNVNPPPEMQTPEQRAETRRLANEEAKAQAQGAVQEPFGVRQALGAQPAPAAAQATPPATPEAHAEAEHRAGRSRS